MRSLVPRVQERLPPLDILADTEKPYQDNLADENAFRMHI